ncbi:type II CAAX endopeptidase family protein [Rhodanobacter sp. OR87]|uniref:CPBP family intramembrane glutamic endopeptidase n=1 Tax=Rhodanobacter sp. OR87 TaxID=1076523 RepID=UPI0003FE5F12|nr:type II CAAX endopeptidase family protein [Rhodanobacter sp. OR87]
MKNRWRAMLAFVVLWLLYQSAEGVGGRWLHSFPVQAGLMLSCVLVAWPLSRWLGYRGYGAYALTRRHGWQTWLPAGLLLAVLAKFAAVRLGLAWGVYAPDPQTASGGVASLLSALPLLLLSTFVASLAEDILTRGFWYRAAGVHWRGGVVFVLASSTIYVLNHIYRLADGPLEWFTLFSFGLAYAAALWCSGSLWAAVGLHWGWNLGNGVVDATLPATVVDARMAPCLSIGAHLLLLVLALPKSRVASQVVDERQ